MMEEPTGRKDAGLTFRYAGRLRQIFLASYKDPRALRVLKSSEAITRDRGRQLMANVYTIHPFSDFRWFWDFFKCIFIFLVTFGESLLLTFEFIGLKSEQNIGNMKYLLYFMNVAFFVDIILNFFTGYYDKETRCIQMKVRKTAVHYLKNRFIFHVIFSIPWYALTKLFKISYDCVHDVCYAEGLDFRDMFSILSAVRIIRIIEISEFLNSLEKVTLRYKFIYQGLNIFVYTFIIFHFASCAQLNVYGIAVSLGINNDYSWYIRENFTEVYGKGILNQYSKTFYRASSCLMLYGGGPINESVEDRILTTILRIVGFMYILYVMSYFLIIMRSVNWDVRNHQYVTKNMDELSKFRRLNKAQKKRIEHYMRYKYDEMFFNEIKVSKMLSNHLLKEIQEYCNKKAVDRVDMLASLPATAKSLIVSALKEDYYLPGDTIIEAGVKGDCMYFLSIGKVAIYDPAGREITHLKDGSYFGEVAMISDKAVRTATVVAINMCELYVLYKKDFRAIIRPYPDLFVSLRRNVEETLARRDLQSNQFRRSRYSIIIESIEHLIANVDANK